MTDAMPYTFYIRDCELCIMISFDIQYKIGIFILYEWRYM